MSYSKEDARCQNHTISEVEVMLRGNQVVDLDDMRSRIRLADWLKELVILRTAAYNIQTSLAKWDG